MLTNDTLANVLYIDLSNKHYWVRSRPDLFNKYLGGTGVAIQLLHEECPTCCDPLSAENPIVLAVGPLTGLFPLASKTVAMFKSPHTGDLGESHCGGRSAVAIRMAGYGAIIIKGASNIPLYLAVHDDKVYFRDASSIWGIEDSSTVGRIIRENEPGAGLRTIMRIGGAGEKLVSYACVTTETYRHFGRMGLGSVFGSKKLKALVVSGRRSLPVTDIKTYRQVYDEIYQTAVTSPVMKKYHDLGTAENVLPLNSFGGLPTKNLTEERFDGAAGISGETFAEQYLGRRLACTHCPVGCIHIAALREPYVDEPYFYKTHMISYDYEPIYALGSMLGISDARGFLRLMEQVEVFGLDAMSTGVVLAWATEAQGRGIISEKETMGLKFNWGDYDTFMKAVKLIVKQPNNFYSALARGVKHTSSIYGGTGFALSLNGNEMPGYHTGPGAHIGVLVGARHSHLDNAGYSVDQKLMSKKSVTPDELAVALLTEERWRQVLSSLVVCFFARGVYQQDVILKALGMAGFSLTREDLDHIGEDIHRSKYRFKFREGFSLDDINLPNRILEANTPFGKLEETYIKSVVESFKKSLSV
ncbi:aldehyde ferredoxin oxidoreductase N-terminal domain-containing protein [Chloroflexota bacterium]